MGRSIHCLLKRKEASRVPRPQPQPLGELKIRVETPPRQEGFVVDSGTKRLPECCSLTHPLAHLVVAQLNGFDAVIDANGRDVLLDKLLLAVPVPGGSPSRGSRGQG